ncbi:class I SAM-dependent methyltransferase [Agaribacterium sp. ZY112]|uniref:class I SAM-dependent methyltransferase n=1 Tax=Agaribacterium sp. ZY112 TaxID=3233574 RepID=UPI003524865F
MPDLSPIVECIESWQAAVADGRRRSLDSCRLFHGRGQCYPGLEQVLLDYYEPALVLTLFSPLQVEDELLVLLQGLFPEAPIYLQCRYEAQPRYVCVYGQALSELYARRGSQRFLLNLDQQNIGFFLDAEYARQWLESRAKDKSVLNLFSYTCSFSIVASAAGASSALNMDLSSRSLSLGRHNYRLNGIAEQQVRFYANDIMKSWSRLKRFGPYDLVVCDPPSFQKGSFVATKDYKKLLRRMDSLTTSSAELLLCLNSPEIRFTEFKALCDSELECFDFVERLGLHPDFPDADSERALKLLVYKKKSAL